MKTILVTGCAGFIGYHVSKALLDRGDKVVGIDNLNEYYDVTLKKARLDILRECKGFNFYKVDISEAAPVNKVYGEQEIDSVCHLAAQAGVRYSLENPGAYILSNEVGFFNMIEGAKSHDVSHFVFASSSSVYGKNKKVPFSVTDPVDHPISLYAATKKSNELTAHTYSHLHGLNCTGLRFFTVYGPYGRPDMALFKFTKAILADRPIDVYNYGKMRRDFTYIDDIVTGVVASLDKPFKYEIFNLGNNKIVELLYFIECIENVLGKKAGKNMMPMQPGDVEATWADIDHSVEKLGYRPKTKIEKGIEHFMEWYKTYYSV
jgi:UDP-glucuronate 4-epimerase